MCTSDCFRYTRPCMVGDCQRDAAFVMYEYFGSYRWSTDGQVQLFYACPEHVEQLAMRHRNAASDIVPYDDAVPF